MMALYTCRRCLARLSLSSSTPLRPSEQAATSRAQFSSTSLALATGMGHASSARTTRTLRLSKKKRVKNYKPPAVGERKALRKRIVLSNTNALEVPGLPEWSRSNCTSPELAGKVVGFSTEVLDSLRALESFKPSQGWGLFRRPACVVRDDTLELGLAMQEAQKNKTAVRRLVVGSKGCGKSVMLLQAQAMALMRGWVVIHFPEAQDLTSATTAYAPIADTNPTRYSQKDYTAALLSRTAKANHRVLRSLKATQPHPSLPIQTKGTTLAQLCERGAADPDLAWPVFTALWAELTAAPADQPQQQQQQQQQQPRAAPPVLLSLDGLAYISRLTAYLAPSMHNIHPHDLSLVSHFIACLSGAQALPHGGAVLAADSMSGRPRTPALDRAVRLSEESSARAAVQPAEEEDHAVDQITRSYEEYSPADTRALDALRAVPVLRLQGLTKAETRAALEYYAHSGMIRATVTEGLVGEAWTLSGGGIVGELERGSVKLGLL